MKQNFRKPISWLLTLAMLIAMLPSFISTASAASSEGYDGTPVVPTKITSENYTCFGLTASNWSSFSGYYGIRSASELYGFAEMVNSNTARAKLNAVLLQDIVVNTGTVTQSGSSGSTTYAWTPMGTLDYPYTYHFNGNGHTISGLYVNTPNSGYVGLFGVADGITSSRIENVTVTNSCFVGAYGVGGIVGYCFGANVSIENCKVDSDVGVYAASSLVGTTTDAYVGGILGDALNIYESGNCVNISNCVSFATVKGMVADDHIGAISGIGGDTEELFAHEYISANNCWYLAGSAMDRNGNAMPGLGHVKGHSWEESGCTSLSSTTASHTCVNVTHKEVNGTCVYSGCSEYSFCLICGTATGNKTVYAIDGDNHATNEVTYQNLGTTTHDAHCKACGKYVSTADHVFDGYVDCSSPQSCLVCGHTGYKYHYGSSYTYKVNETDRTKHDAYCTHCGDYSFSEEHLFSGGYCTEPGSCVYCHEPNDEDASNHTSSAVTYGLNETDNTKHDIFYACCGAHKSSEAHSYVSGVCEHCQYICSHTSMSGGKCAVCGQSSYKYVTRTWDETQNKVVSGTAEIGLDSTTVLSTTTTWTDGWYLVNSAVTVEECIIVTGDVKLLLCDGSNLEASAGIIVAEGNSLTIYGQSADSGTLIATGIDQSAGIGGDPGVSDGSAGAVTIVGGTVTATAGRSGAGIGGGRYCSGGAVTILGGTVTATSSASGAGIGGGAEGGAGGTVNIYGGTITAIGSSVAAGIGGGSLKYPDVAGSGGTVGIYGGTVTATGGNNAAGIGGGQGGAGGIVTITDGTVTATGGISGAGIGGGTSGTGGTVTISGGTVTATGGKYAAGIGGGSAGSGGTVTISGGTVTATGGDYAADIGGGFSGNGGTVIITGGNVYAPGLRIGSGSKSSGSAALDPGTLTDALGNSVYLVKMYLNDAADSTDVTLVANIGSYGLNDVKTIGNSLYFYLPSGVTASAVTAGGVDYVCNRASTFYTYHNGGTCISAGFCPDCGQATEKKPDNHAMDTYTNGFLDCCGEYQSATLVDGIYRIVNAGQLFWFAELVNSGNYDANAVLAADIDLDTLYWKAFGRSADTAYTGTFDGKGFSIKNLNRNNGQNEGTRESFTYYVGTGGSIANVIFDSPSVFTQGHAGANASAVVALRSSGTISNCMVINAVIQLGNYAYLAGLVGVNEPGSVIENCAVVNTELTRRFGHTHSRAAIVHTNNGTVRNCYAYGCIYNNDNDANGGIIVSGNAPENCYYYTTSTMATTYGTAMTTEQFTSGEVAYLLNGNQTSIVWKQTITEDNLPSFTGSIVYYGYVSCADDAVKVFTNSDTASETKPNHTAEATDFTWATDLSTAALAVSCAACDGSANINCTVSCDVQSSVMTITATAKVDGYAESFSDSKEIKIVDSTLSLSEGISVEEFTADVIIIVAAYNDVGQMLSVEYVGTDMAITVTGDTVRVFFLKQSYTPVLPALG